MYNIIRILALLYVVSLVTGVKFTKCDSTDTIQIMQFDAQGCDADAVECSFDIGKQYELDFVFKNNGVVANKLPYTLIGTIFGFPIKIAEGDACTMTGFTCPVQPGQEATGKLIAKVTNDAPIFSGIKMSARVWHDVIETNEEASACGYILVNIKEAPTP